MCFRKADSGSQQTHNLPGTSPQRPRALKSKATMEPIPHSLEPSQILPGTEQTLQSLNKTSHGLSPSQIQPITSPDAG